MTDVSNIPQPQTKPGVATAEEGLVILDGPYGIAVTMTAQAAQETGHSLILAAGLAAEQAADSADRERP